jgi:hypothetical protein
MRAILNLWLPSSSDPHLNIRFEPHIKQTVLARGLSDYRARRRLADSRGPVLVAGLSPNK